MSTRRVRPPLAAARALALDRTATLSVFTMAVSGFAAVGFAALTPLIRDDLALSATAVGAIVSVFYLAGLLTVFPSGRLADRLGAKTMIGAGQAFIAVGLVAMALAPSALAFFAGVAVLGCAYGAVTPAATLLAAGTESPLRGWVMGVKQSGVTIGIAVAGAILPALATASDWRSALALPALACLIAALALAPAAGRERRGLPSARPPAEPPPARPTAEVRFPRGLGAYGFLMSGFQFFVTIYLAVYLVDQRELSAQTAGTAVAVAFTGGTAGRLAWGLMSDRLFASRIPALQLTGAGAAALAAALVLGGDAVLWPVLALLGFCCVGWNGVYQAAAVDQADASSYGRASGAALSYLFLGAVALPPLLGALLSLTSWSGAWLIAAICPAMAAVAAGVGVPRSRQDLK